ncbi:MAG: hypothetical protein Q8N99_05345 [Nanoarchaeota archaeon]|nr:hypothetical protein [Nanoarchaeota archaeon]
MEEILAEKTLENHAQLRLVAVRNSDSTDKMSLVYIHDPSSEKEPIRTEPQNSDYVSEEYFMRAFAFIKTHENFLGVKNCLENFAKSKKQSYCFLDAQESSKRFLILPKFSNKKFETLEFTIFKGCKFQNINYSNFSLESAVHSMQISLDEV